MNISNEEEYREKFFNIRETRELKLTEYSSKKSSAQGRLYCKINNTRLKHPKHIIC